MSASCPFALLDLPLETTAAAVEARFLALTTDTDRTSPEEAARLRAAYLALKTEARLETARRRARRARAFVESVATACSPACCARPEREHPPRGNATPRGGFPMLITDLQLSVPVGASRPGRQVRPEKPDAVSVRFGFMPYRSCQLTFERWVEVSTIDAAVGLLAEIGFPPSDPSDDPDYIGIGHNKEAPSIRSLMTRNRRFRVWMLDPETTHALRQPQTAHAVLALAARPMVEHLAVDGLIRKDAGDKLAPLGSYRSLAGMSPFR